MTNQEKKDKICELTEHNPVWSGDGYFCSGCMLKFETAPTHRGSHTPTEESWLERFMQKFFVDNGQISVELIDELEAFIRSEIEQAEKRAEERTMKDIIILIRGNDEENFATSIEEIESYALSKNINIKEI